MTGYAGEGHDGSSDRIGEDRPGSDDDLQIGRDYPATAGDLLAERVGLLFFSGILWFLTRLKIRVSAVRPRP